MAINSEGDHAGPGVNGPFSRAYVHTLSNRASINSLTFLSSQEKDYIPRKPPLLVWLAVWEADEFLFSFLSPIKFN